MTVLVTGGAGYIGSHMVLALRDQGETVVVLDNLSTGQRRLVPAEVNLVVGDVGDRALVADVIARHGVDAIIHFAGSIVVPDSVTDPLGYYHNNTVKSHALIQSAVAAGVPHFIFSSTAAVYGNPGNEPVSEDAATVPVSPYGSSKLMTEWMLRDTSAAHEFRSVALRYFNVAGADPQGRSGQATPRATHLIKVACETALGKRPHMEIFGTDYSTPDGTCLRDYIHVSDLARAHAAALAYLRAGGDATVLNCGYSKGYSVRDVVNAVKRVSGRDFKVRLSPRRPGDPAAIVAASERIRATLGWQPELDDLDTIVRHALAWEQSLPAA
jgi:UDP-glucose 4-epimerase